MARTNRWSVAKQALSDPYGNVWCAWCLDYIDKPNDLELHHVLGKKEDIEDIFDFEPWVVPVHKHPERCHRERLQDYAQQAGRSLLDARNLEGFEDRCLHAFYLGYLPACLYLRRRRSKDTDDRHVARKHLMLALNAAAGSGQGGSFVQDLAGDPDLRALLDDMNVQLYVASVQGNFGNLSLARRACRELESLVPRVNGCMSPFYAKLVRMQAILEPTVRTAREVVTIAYDSHDPQYHGCTSRLALASAYDTSADYAASRDVALELGSLMQTGPSLWWHRIQYHTIWAKATILSAGTRPSVQVLRLSLMNLIRAQYAAAFLDSVGIPLPDFRSFGHNDTLVPLRPTDVIHWLGSTLLGGTQRMSKVEMTELRREALLGDSSPRDAEETWPRGFQAQVVNTIREGLPSEDIGCPMPLS